MDTGYVLQSQFTPAHEDALATKHPSFPGTGPIFQTIAQLRKSLPAQVTADTLKRLGLAPGNESRILNVLKFVGIIDEQSNRTDTAKKVFATHDDGEFATSFGELVKAAYGDLFELHHDAAWTLDPGKLISYFRQADQTSSLVGQRQATTFQALAALAGHAEVPVKRVEPESRPRRGRAKQPVVEQERRSADVQLDKSAKDPPPAPPNGRDVDLTVRIEINLPAGGDQATYDRIFRSIRENLINAG